MHWKISSPASLSWNEKKNVEANYKNWKHSRTKKIGTVPFIPATDPILMIFGSFLGGFIYFLTCFPCLLGRWKILFFNMPISQGSLVFFPYHKKANIRIGSFNLPVMCEVVFIHWFALHKSPTIQGMCSWDTSHVWHIHEEDKVLTEDERMKCI